MFESRISAVSHLTLEGPRKWSDAVAAIGNAEQVVNRPPPWDKVGQNRTVESSVINGYRGIDFQRQESTSKLPMLPRRGRGPAPQPSRSGPTCP